MPKLAPCPPIVPPAFEPSAAARDALASAQRAHAAAELAVRDAEDNARSARAATARAELDFSAEDSDERWTQLEAARRRETSATLRAKRCADELTAATAALESANAAITAERIEHARARASSLRLVENMRAPLALVASAMRDLLAAREGIEAAEREYARAYQALPASERQSAAFRSDAGTKLARYVAGRIVAELFGDDGTKNEAMGLMGRTHIDLVMPMRGAGDVALSPAADELVRAIALEAIK